MTENKPETAGGEDESTQQTSPRFPADTEHMKEQLKQDRDEERDDSTPVTGPDDVFGSKGAVPKADQSPPA